jgi:hypothetical protein
MSTTEVSINQAKDIVRNFLKSDKHLPLFLHSCPGVGKSSIIAQLAQEIDEEMRSKVSGNKATSDASSQKMFGFIDVRLGCMPEYDVQGIPFIKQQGTNKEEMVYSVPEWFPSVEKVKDGVYPEFGVVFLDELSNASFNTQQAAYRIVLDRAIHAATMAPGWKIVAAGNLKTDNTGAKNVLPALANRFATHLFIKPSVEDFTGYAIEKGLRKEIIGFLNFSRSHLYDVEGAKRSTSFASPRSWESVSHLLNLFESKPNMMFPALSGCIGEATTVQFTSYMKYYEQLPNFTEIMEGKAKYKLPKDNLGLAFAVTSSVICCLVEHHANKKYLKNLNDVILKQMNSEFLTLIFKSLVFNKDKTIVRDVFTHEDCQPTFKAVAEFLV